MLGKTYQATLSVVFLAMALIVPNNASAADRRVAQVQIRNETGKIIRVAAIVHKYSNVYKHKAYWQNIPSGGSSATMNVEYNTGPFTTGRDWWVVSWEVEGDDGLYLTDPSNFRELFDAWDGIADDASFVIGTIAGVFATAATGVPEFAEYGGTAATMLSWLVFNKETTSGFKQHILRTEDEGKTTVITIREKEVLFNSPSGESSTQGIRRVRR